MTRASRKTRRGKWTTTAPTVKGWYWYRDTPTAEARVLQVRDMWKTGHFSAWDWDPKGCWRLCPVTGYPGEWFGPIVAPP